MNGIQGPAKKPQVVPPYSTKNKNNDVGKYPIKPSADVSVTPIQYAQTVDVKPPIDDKAGTNPIKIETVNQLQEEMSQFPDASFQVKISNAADLQELKKVENVSAKLYKLFGARDLRENTTYSLLLSKSTLECLSVIEKQPNGISLEFAGNPIEIDKETGQVTRCFSVNIIRPNGTQLNFVVDKDNFVEMDPKNTIVTKCLRYIKKAPCGDIYYFYGDTETPVKIDSNTKIVSQCLMYSQQIANGTYIYTGNNEAPVKLNLRDGSVESFIQFKYISPVTKPVAALGNLAFNNPENQTRVV
ncbi:MAG: hypothetical protein ISQ13_03230 [Candidatus Margulisbacteria bacterium]|nr:hypothetical protein [Candidatus Margulisiibacteriota bacterium]